MYNNVDIIDHKSNIQNDNNIILLLLMYFLLLFFCISKNHIINIENIQWVNNQTSLIGNNSVNINVGTREEQYLKDTNGNYILDDNGNKIITQEAGQGKTTLTGALIASGQYETITNKETGQTETIFTDNNNLTLNTKQLDYKDINDFNTTTTKGYGFDTSLGTSPDNFFKGIKPEGSTTITHINEGSEKEGITRATIGNGSIIIADKEINEENNNLNLIRDLNRNTNNIQQLTKDQITGAANATFQIDNRVFTVGGWQSIYSDVKNAPGNFKWSIIGASKDVDRIIEGTYTIGEKVGSMVGGDVGKSIFGNILRYTIGSTVGGIASAFGETNSKIIVADKDANGNILKDEKGNTITKTITREELASGDYKNYEVLGIMSGEKRAISEINLKPNTAERTNPTDGYIGDLVECWLMKLFNSAGASNMMAMSREVSLDLKELSKDPSNTNIENVNFHSQGTIIEQGALQIYKKQYTDNNGNKTSYQEQIPLNPNINYNSLGYAVYEDTIRDIFSKDLGINSDKDSKDNKVKFDRDDKDSVQQLAAPKNFKDFVNGIKNLTNIDTHSINNSRYDKYYDSINLIERSKIDMKRHGGKKNTNYNLVGPGINNNGVNYVIPSYTNIVRDKK